MKRERKGAGEASRDQPDDCPEVGQADQVSDVRMGLKAIHSTVLTSEDKAVVVAFRRHTLLPLDDCLYSLQPSIPCLTRSALHRCLQRHGISRLSDMTGVRPAKQKFKVYAIGKPER